MDRQQQGDVTFERVDGISKEALAVNGFDGVIAQGEATGHHHRVAVLDRCKAFSENGFMILEISGPTEVVHEEHKTITLDPGVWKIGRVQEYDHFAEETRQVAD